MHTPCLSGEKCVRMAVGDSPGQVSQYQKSVAPLPAWLPGRGSAPRNEAAAFPACWGRICSAELSHHCLWEIFSLGSWQLLPAAHALLCLCLWQSSSSLKHLLGLNAGLVLQPPPKAFQVLFSCLLNLWREACPSLHATLCFPSWGLTLQISYIMHNVIRNSCSL